MKKLDSDSLRVLFYNLTFHIFSYCLYLNQCVRRHGCTVGNVVLCYLYVVNWFAKKSEISNFV